MKQKADDYFKQFQKADAEKKKLVDAKLMSEKDYLAWRQSAMLTGKRWDDMADVLAKDMVNADKIAAAVIGERLPDTYALNANYGTYEIEHGLGIDTSWTMYDHSTVENLMRDNPQMIPKPRMDIPKDMRWNRQKITSAITQGVLQGDSIPEISRRLRSVTNMDRTAAIRNARTYTTAAENKGRIDSYQRAKELGIDLQKEWMATPDGRTRDSHVDLDGERVEIDATFSNGCRYPADPYGAPSEVYNCFVAETNVTTDSNIIRSYKHEYEGELIKIKTASGVNFTCTPNHPILSDRGWVRVASLNEGNNLLVARFGDEIFTRRNPHVNHVHARMDTLHKFLDVLGSQRTTTLSVNFHGDIPTSEVEVVTFKGLLRNNFNLGRCKAINKFLLKFTDKTLSYKGTLVEHFGSICLVAFGFICRMSKPFSIIGRCLRHTQIHRFGTVARNNASFTKSQIDNISTASEFCGECFDRRSIEIFADNIISIDRCISNCHVYNLQTENGRYFVNSSITENGTKCNDIYAIAHNCRCTLVAAVEGRQYHDDRFTRLPDGMTYDDWKAHKLKR